MYVLAAASLSPAGVLSGMSVSPSQLDASFAAAVGLARLCAHGAPEVAALSLQLLLQRCAMFTATGRFDMPSVLLALRHALQEYRGTAPPPARDGFALLALLLRAGAGAPSVAELAAALSSLAVQSE